MKNWQFFNILPNPKWRVVVTCTLWVILIFSLKRLWKVYFELLFELKPFAMIFEVRCVRVISQSFTHWMNHFSWLFHVFRVKSPSEKMKAIKNRILAKRAAECMNIATFANLCVLLRWKCTQGRRVGHTNFFLIERESDSITLELTVQYMHPSWRLNHPRNLWKKLALFDNRVWWQSLCLVSWCVWCVWWLSLMCLMTVFDVWMRNKKMVIYILACREKKMVIWELLVHKVPECPEPRNFCGVEKSEIYGDWYQKSRARMYTLRMRGKIKKKFEKWEEK